jgi:hypothetical protein
MTTKEIETHMKDPNPHVALWEIAYQLAVQNEQAAAMREMHSMLTPLTVEEFHRAHKAHSSSDYARNMRRLYLEPEVFISLNIPAQRHWLAIAIAAESPK